MKNKLLTFAGALALLAVLGHFYAKPLLAQVRAALVQNVDEKGRNYYQVSGSCTSTPPPFGNPNCDVVFPPIPQNMRAVIEHVSVDITANNNFDPELVLFEDVSGLATAVLQPFVRSAAPSFGCNQSLLLYAQAGEQPKLHVTNASVNSATISGYLIDLTK